MPKGRWHPSNTTGMQKQMRVREAEKIKDKKKVTKIKPIDTSKGNWSNYAGHITTDR